MTSAIVNTYTRLPVNFARGEGVWLFDESGKRYLDALSGIAVCGLGHVHPAVTKAINEQASKLIHTSNLYGIPVQEKLASALVAHCDMDAVFFCNSGAEANEAAIKVARAYGHGRGVDAPAIIVMQGAFHGRTLATLSATASHKVHAGFEPLVSGFVRVAYGDHEAVEAIARTSNDVVAILVEPILGEGGVIIPPQGYLRELRAICDEHQWLLMFDEIQTGMGRTGKWFAHQHEDIVPDVMTLAKSLGNGVPIGACLVGGMAKAVLAPGMHGSTFGGNPLASAAALAVVNTIADEKLVEHAAAMGERLQQGLREGLAGLNSVREVRGRGLMIAVEMAHPCGELVATALERGMLINVTAEQVLRLLPPIIISEQEVDELVDGLCKLVRDWSAGVAA
ncbi:MAG: acetylornithine/N-succinyldiaminopimelate aminotransferase [Gammaproteobacteria bacterium]|jgi:acetylornithine/N-succinyldiaminopimelate aminotransferase